MQRLEKYTIKLIEFSGKMAVLFLLFLMLMTVADVVLRYFFRRPILGSTEISVSLIVCVVFLGIALCALRGRHLSIDLISGIISDKTKLILDSIDNILTMIFALLVAIQSFSHGMYAREMEFQSTLLSIPRYPFILVTAYGFFLLFLASIILQCNIKKGLGDKIS